MFKNKKKNPTRNCELSLSYDLVVNHLTKKYPKFKKTILQPIFSTLDLLICLISVLIYSQLNNRY